MTISTNSPAEREPFPLPSAKAKRELIESAPHLQYAFDVLEGEIVAGELTKRACERAIIDHTEREFEGDWVFEWRYAKAFISFCSLVPHVRGEFARKKKTMVLTDWQKFFFGEVYGWRSASDHFKRRFQEVILECAKKQGKTSLAALVALFETKYGDHGAEVYTCATKADQARKCWDDSLSMIEAMPNDLARGFTAKTSEIACRHNGKKGIFKFLSKQTKSLDGPDPSCLIIDEAAAITDNAVVDKLTPSMASRTSPLVVYITHAQYATTTVYYSIREHLRAILEGAIEPAHGERMFGMIFNQDSKEELEDESTWQKSNPNLGVNVQLDYLRDKWQSAQHRPIQKDAVLTYHFNFWVSSSNKWIDMEKWDACASDEIIRESYCVVGVDLSATQDLTAVCRIFPHEKSGWWYCDWRLWTIQNYLDEVPEMLLPIYSLAEESGILIVQDTEAIDYEDIDRYVRETAKEYKIAKIGVDPANARDLNAGWVEAGLPVMSVTQQARNLNDPRQEVERRILSHKLVHDGNPFMSWQLDNCSARKNDDILFITKPKNNPHLKIDGMAALFTAARCVSETFEPEYSPRITWMSV